MVTNNKENGSDMYCQCPNCQGHYHGHYWLRWLVGLFILLVVFWLGVKIGEFKGEFADTWDVQGRSFGRHMMMPYNQYYGAPPMFFNQAVPNNGNLPTTTIPPTTKTK
jgi:hypothetical protein